MKAERRHELKTNTLAKNLENAPAFFQKYGSRVLLGVILCLLAYILTTNYLTSKANKAQKAGESLGNALGALRQLKTLPPQAPPEYLADQRKKLNKEIDEAVRDVVENSADTKLKAQALVVRGDLDWQLATFPVLPGATTRPELQLDKSKEDLLSAAADAYGEVLQSPLNEDHLSVTAARFGLAYIAENRSQWDKARSFYQQIIDDGATDKGAQEFAHHQMDELASLQLQKPVVLGSPADTHGAFTPPPSVHPHPSRPATPTTGLASPATQATAPISSPSVSTPVKPPTTSSTPTTRPSQP